MTRMICVLTTGLHDRLLGHKGQQRPEDVRVVPLGAKHSSGGD